MKIEPYYFYFTSRFYSVPRCRQREHRINIEMCSLSLFGLNGLAGLEACRLMGLSAYLLIGCKHLSLEALISCPLSLCGRQTGTKNSEPM